MHRHEQHVRPVPEDALRPVAMVAVDIEDRHPLGAFCPQPLRRHRRVVQVAVPPGPSAVSVVSGGAGEGVGDATLGGFIRCRGGSGGGVEGGFPGMRPDRAGGVGGEPTHLAHDVCRCAGAVRHHLGRGVVVGDHFRPGVGDFGPGSVAVAQKGQVVGLVHSQQRRDIQRRRRYHGQPQIPARRQQGFRSDRNVKVRTHGAARQEEVRGVGELGRVPEDLHARTSGDQSFSCSFPSSGIARSFFRFARLSHENAAIAPYTSRMLIHSYL